jgi:hypothetical protein
MADVVEVIHKINYEVNDVSLQRATAYISLQLNELTKLNKQLEIYGRELDNSLGAGQARVEELTRRIETLQQQLGKTSAATKTTLDKLFSGIAKGATDVEGRASGLVNTILNNLGTLGTKGASSIKNVSSAAAEVTRVAGGTASILGSVVNAGKTLFSSTNLWALAATVLTSLDNGVMQNEVVRSYELLQGVDDLVANKGAKWFVEADVAVLKAMLKGKAEA